MLLCCACAEPALSLCCKFLCTPQGLRDLLGSLRDLLAVKDIDAPASKPSQRTTMWLSTRLIPSRRSEPRWGSPMQVLVFCLVLWFAGFPFFLPHVHCRGPCRAPLLQPWWQLRGHPLLGRFAPPRSFRPHPWSFSSKHGGAHSRAPMEATAPSCFHRGALPGGTAGRRPFPAVPIRRGGPMFVPLLSSLAISGVQAGSQVGLLDATNFTMAVPACAAPSNAYLASWSLPAGPATPQQPRAPQRSAGLCSRRGRTNRGD